MEHRFIPGASSSAALTKISQNQFPTYEEILQQKIYQQQLDNKILMHKSTSSQQNATCANVPLPPQAYDEPRQLSMAEYLSTCDPRTSSGLQPRATIESVSQGEVPLTSPNSKKRKKTENSTQTSQKAQHCLEYPRPAIPYNYEHLYIGANETLIPWDFYVKVPWYSYELSTRYLAEFVFERETLATHTLHGKQHLDRPIVEDIVTHVSDRCGVGEEHIVFTIAKICADFSKLHKRGLLNNDMARAE